MSSGGAGGPTVVRMRIAVLGPLEVLTEELAPVAVPGAKERLLLAVLTASAPGVVSSDRLVDTLWDGTPPDSARKSLQAHSCGCAARWSPTGRRAPPAGTSSAGAGVRAGSRSGGRRRPAHG